MDWTRDQRGYPLVTGARGLSVGRRNAGCSSGTGPAIEEWRIPQNVPSSGEDEVCELETPDTSKGHAMTNAVKTSTSSFIAVDLMGSFGSSCRTGKVLARRASPLNVAYTCSPRSRLFGEGHDPDGSGAPRQSQATGPVEGAVRQSPRPLDLLTT